MSYEGQKPLMLTGAKLGATVADADKFKFVKLNADHQVILCTGVTDKPIGVLQSPGSSGDAVDVVVEGETQVQADVSLAAGDSIGTSADGQAAKYTAADTTKYIVGQVTNVAGGTTAGNLVTAVINCANARTLA